MTRRAIRAYPFLSLFSSCLSRILYVYRRYDTRAINDGSCDDTISSSSDASPDVETRVLTASSWPRRRASRESGVGTFAVMGSAQPSWRRPAGLYGVAFLLSLYLPLPPLSLFPPFSPFILLSFSLYRSHRWI